MFAKDARTARTFVRILMILSSNSTVTISSDSAVLLRGITGDLVRVRIETGKTK